EKKIEGLKGILGSSGFTVVTHKIQNRDACQLIIDSKVVWSCNITTLQTGGGGKEDPLCLEAL
ncbi:Hypothetical predicted protein, partial [Mytilus galloprovincialis]